MTVRYICQHICVDRPGGREIQTTQGRKTGSEQDNYPSPCCTKALRRTETLGGHVTSYPSLPLPLSTKSTVGLRTEEDEGPSTICRNKPGLR